MGVERFPITGAGAGAGIGRMLDVLASRQTKPCSVAIADDDPTLLLLLKTLLGADPCFEVVGEAADGNEAVALCEDSPCPDVLLLDLNMPYMTGYDVLRRLKAICPPLIIVVHSGEDEREGRGKVGDIGDFEYVVKGDPTKLLSKLRQVCDSVNTG